MDWRNPHRTLRVAVALQRPLRRGGSPHPDCPGPGDTFTFERGATKSIGGHGWADVWYRGHFAWEYKGPHKDLVKAYDQLLRYKDDLENPPLLIVSDLNIIEIHTNFTGTAKQVHKDLHSIFADDKSQKLLRQVFFEPQSLRPGLTVEGVTEAAARQFGAIALGMHARGVDPPRAAHFLMQLLFCLFAESVLNALRERPL